MKVTSSSKSSAEVKVGEVTLYFSITEEKGIWLTAKSSYGPSYVEKEKFNEARRLATEAIASHHFAPRDTASIAKLALSSPYLRQSPDTAVEAIFSSLKIPPYNFLKWMVTGKVKNELGNRSKKRAEVRKEQKNKKEGEERETERQLVLLL